MQPQTNYHQTVLRSARSNLTAAFRRWHRTVLPALIALLLAVVIPARADSLVAWGDNSINQISPLPPDTDLTAISAGGGHSVAIKANRTVVVWGLGSFGQLDVPPGLANVVGAAAGYDHTVAVRSDGKVVSWGRNHLAQTNVPPDLANVVAVSANGYHSLALTAGGTVVAWGDNSSGQGNVPPGLTDVVAISSGSWHNLALRRDGTVVGWGANDRGQSVTPPGLSSVVEIVAGGEHNLARKADGTVVAWGQNNFGQTNVADGLSDIVGIAAGFAHSMVRRADGTVVARGWNDLGQSTVPPGLSGVTAVSGGFQHSVALVSSADPRPIIHCPADARLTCAECNTDPANTGTATAQDNRPVRIAYTDETSGDCPKTVRRTWTATDDAGQTASCVQTITCRAADTTLVITCPRDVLRACTDCILDPSQTGTAAATGAGQVRVTYTDSSHGECPKVVKRTWTATDDSGQTTSCVQRLTCMPANLVTDSSGCVFDRNPSTPEQDFRLTYTQDPQNLPCYRLTASNPGGFLYTVLQTGTPGQNLTLDLTLPYPFVTKGVNPIHAFDWVTVSHPGDRPCVQVGEPVFAGSQQVELADYGTGPNAFTAVSLSIRVPDSGVIFLVVRLDYGLRHTTGYSKNSHGDAVDCDTGLQVLIPSNGHYVFSVSGVQTADTSIQNENAFKRTPGVFGFVRNAVTDEPVPGTVVTLTTPRGGVAATRATDEDGFYFIAYKHKGKEAVYSVSIVTPGAHQETKTVALKANRYVNLDFDIP